MMAMNHNETNEVYANLISAWHELRAAQIKDEPMPTAAHRIIDAIELLDTSLREDGPLPSAWFSLPRDRQTSRVTT